MTPVRLEPEALRSRVKHSTTKPLRSLPYGCDNQNLANVKFVKYYPLRAFPENLKQSSLMLMNIWRLEATFIIWFGTWRQEVC